MGGMGYQYFYPLLDDYMQQSAMDRPRSLRTWTWQDSSKIVNFFNLHMLRSKKYALDIPITTNSFVTKEELKQKENELVEYFLYELRKPASANKK